MINLNLECLNQEFPIRNRQLAEGINNSIKEISSKKFEKKTSSHVNKQKALIEKNKVSYFLYFQT